MARSLLRALRNTGIVVIYQTPDLTVVWSQNVPSLWTAGGDIVGLSDSDFLPPGAANLVVEHKRRVLSSGAPETLEFRVGGSDGGRWYDMWVDADHDEDGAIVGLVTTVVDITDRKHREQTLRALLREVSHRSKNLLAIIQSVATQTGRYSTTIETFLERFRGRLQSLASSQDLVTSSNWRGATLVELIDGQLNRFLGDNGRAVRFEGADVHLSPNAALHIGLALHELVVNSMSHGALSLPSGQVKLRSVLQDDDSGGRALVLTWDEETGSSEPAGERRFGSIALERVVPRSLDGHAELTLENGHFGYRLEVPSANFEPE
jgi:two-component sensor histidine kinase